MNYGIEEQAEESESESVKQEAVEDEIEAEGERSEEEDLEPTAQALSYQQEYEQAELKRQQEQVSCPDLPAGVRIALTVCGCIVGETSEGEQPSTNFARPTGRFREPSGGSQIVRVEDPRDGGASRSCRSSRQRRL